MGIVLNSKYRIYHLSLFSSRVPKSQQKNTLCTIFLMMLSHSNALPELQAVFCCLFPEVVCLECWYWIKVCGRGENTKMYDPATNGRVTFLYSWVKSIQPSLLRRLKRRRPFTAKAPPIGKIHPISKIGVTFESVMQFEYPSRFRIS